MVWLSAHHRNVIADPGNESAQPPACWPATFRQVLRDGAFWELLVDGQRPSQWRHGLASVLLPLNDLPGIAVLRSATHAPSGIA